LPYALGRGVTVEPAADILWALGAAEQYRTPEFCWPKAMLQYTVGDLDRLALIERRLAAPPGLFVVGNAYRSIDISTASPEAKPRQIMPSHS
jgi:hypothetical protein